MFLISFSFFALAFAIPTQLTKENALDQVERDAEAGLANQNQALKETNIDLMNQIEQKVGGDICHTGYFQSPIDMPSFHHMTPRQNKLLVDVQGPQDVKWGKLDDGSGRSGWKLTHGNVQRWLPSGYGTYKMQSFTIIAPSEHKIQNEQFDAELQIYFHSLDDKYETLKMSIFLLTAPVPDYSEENKRFWEPLMRTINANDGNRAFPIELEYVFNQLPLDRYARYHGSQTSGGCEENVEWIVMGHLVKVDYMFLYLLKRKEDRPTPRAIQREFGRWIERSEKSILPWPEASARESYSGAYSVFGENKDVAQASFALIGAISLIWYGAHAFQKAYISSEFTPIQEAEC